MKRKIFIGLCIVAIVFGIISIITGATLKVEGNGPQETQGFAETMKIVYIAFGCALTSIGAGLGSWLTVKEIKAAKAKKVAK
jgi:hypothetical protein